MGEKSLTEKKARLAKVLTILKRSYPDAHCALNHRNPFELLVATILSAQCTDERVNKVTPALFSAFPSPIEMAGASNVAVEKLIQSTNFFRNKAKSLIECSKALVELHGGNVPKNLEDLTKLRGVGRKTANVVLGNAFGIPGLVVDTHVGRLCRRLGFTVQLDPEEIEQEMMKIVPKSEWVVFSHFLISHGRARCQARKPDCKNCEVQSICPKIGVQ